MLESGEQSVDEYSIWRLDLPSVNPWSDRGLKRIGTDKETERHEVMDYGFPGFFFVAGVRARGRFAAGVFW